MIENDDGGPSGAGTEWNRFADPGPFWLAFDYELALESDRGGHVESVGRSGLDYLVDFFELLRGCIRASFPEYPRIDPLP